MKTNRIIKYGDITLIEQSLFKGTCVEFSDDVYYTLNSQRYGPTYRMWNGTDEFYGKIYGPGTFIDLRPVSMDGKYREIQILEDGIPWCLKIENNLNLTMTYVTGDVTLPPHTAALVASEQVEFIDNDRIVTAKETDLIVERPYEIKIVGQSELILITKGGVANETTN